MPNQETLDLLDAANSALFAAEQAIRKEEQAAGHIGKLDANKPMYGMRIALAAIIREYCANHSVCAKPLRMFMM